MTLRDDRRAGDFTKDLAKKGWYHSFEFPDGTFIDGYMPLEAQKERGDTRDNGSGIARTAADLRAVAGHCARNGNPVRQDALGLVGTAPVTEFLGFTVRIHSADGQHGSAGAGNV